MNRTFLTAAAFMTGAEILLIDNSSLFSKEMLDRLRAWFRDEL